MEAFRGMPAVDSEILCKALISVGKLALDHPQISEIDINPLIIRGSKPVVVDALILLSEQGEQNGTQ